MACLYSTKFPDNLDESYILEMRSPRALGKACRPWRTFGERQLIIHHLADQTRISRNSTTIALASIAKHEQVPIKLLVTAITLATGTMSPRLLLVIAIINSTVVI